MITNVQQISSQHCIINHCIDFKISKEQQIYIDWDHSLLTELEVNTIVNEYIQELEKSIQELV